MHNGLMLNTGYCILRILQRSRVIEKPGAPLAARAWKREKSPSDVILNPVKPLFLPNPS